jgi:hypothetical protein
MRAAWIVGLAGCWGKTTAPAPQQAQPPRAVAIAPSSVEPMPVPKPIPAKTQTLERYSGRDLVTTHLSRDEVVLMDRRTRAGELDVLATSDLDFLGPCMSAFVKAQPITARTVLLDAVGRYATTCRDGVVTLDRPLGCNSGERRTRSDVALVGALTPRGAGLVLRVSSCGSTSTFDKITLHGGNAAWTSPRVELVHDTYGCNVAEIPMTRVLASALRSTLEEDDAVIAFDGSETELALDDTLRDELRSVLAAMDAISAP